MWRRLSLSETVPASQRHFGRAGTPHLSMGLRRPDRLRSHAAFLRRAAGALPIVLDRDPTVSKAWGLPDLPTTFLFDSNVAPRPVAEGDVDWALPEIEEIAAG
jgi:hypothetical protein